MEISAKFELLVTIDTEGDSDSHWRKPKNPSFASVRIGIPKILRPLWDKYGIKPLYFVSPEVLSDDQSCEVLKQEIEKGVLIGAHLHSEYIPPLSKGWKSEFPCYDNSTEMEKKKLEKLTDLIVDKLKVKPEWYRAARYGADLDTIRILKELGYKYDSSATPHISWKKIGGPDHSPAPEQPYWISLEDFYAPAAEALSLGIKEYPITISGKRLGILGQYLPDNWLLYNWLRPSHMSVCEQKKIINNMLDKYEQPTFVMMFHAAEVIPGATPFVRNKLMQKLFVSRLEKILNYFNKLS